MLHIAHATELRMWINAVISARFTRKTPDQGGLSYMTQSLWRQYVMTS